MSVENGPKVEAAIFLFSDLLVYTKKQSLLSRRFKVVRFFFIIIIIRRFLRFTGSSLSDRA